MNLYDLTKPELEAAVEDWGFPRFRADQLWTWLYQHKVQSFDEMHNLPKSFREKLKAEALLSSLELVTQIHSSDGETIKYLLRLPDGQLIETVLMAYDDHRRTACISTQAGCAMGCVFCATGQMGFSRNLTPGEIIEQAIIVARTLEADNERLSNVVMMGMGEPFHNYDATIAALRRLTNPDAFGIGQRHLTVSTVGLVPAINKFAEEALQVRLAISLHAATDEERSALLPVNKRYDIQELLTAVQGYIDKTNRRVTFEWALIAYENDTPEEAHRLGQLLSGMLCHVNVIPLNPTSGYDGRKPDPERVQQFVDIVESYGVPTTIRVRRGIDINAGCGQLKAAVLKGNDGLIQPT